MYNMFGYKLLFDEEKSIYILHFKFEYFIELFYKDHFSLKIATTIEPA